MLDKDKSNGVINENNYGIHHKSYWYIIWRDLNFKIFSFLTSLVYKIHLPKT